MVCSVNPNANTIAKKLCEINPSLNLNESIVSKKIEQGIANGYLSREEVYPENASESVDYAFLLDKVLQMLGDQADVDTEFDMLTPIVVSSTEGFSGDIARASRATHYIGASKQDSGGFQMKMQAAMLAGGRQVMDENAVVDENTVALVEVTTSSDLDVVLKRCERVLDAGGRLLMPTSKEVAEYANKIKDKDKRATYEKTRLALQQAFIDRGYSAREVIEQGGLQAQVIQSIRVQSFDKISFAKDTVMGKAKALNDNVDAKDIVKKAKKMNVSVKAAFVNKEGVSNKDERVSSPTLYEAILAGEVNAIARQDSKNNQYSSLKVGDVIPLRQDADHIIYAEVTDVTPTNKAGYIDMLNNGDIITGYSVASARELMADDKAYTVVQFKPLVEGGKRKKEKTKKKRKGAKSTNSGKTTYRLRYKYDKKAKKMRFWRERVSVSTQDKNDMNSINLYNSLMRAQLEYFKQNGYVVEQMPDEQVQKELQQVTSDAFQKKMSKASAADKQEILEEMGETASKKVFTRNHIFSIGQSSQSNQRNLLINLFKGNYVRMNQFGKSMMQYFRNMAENAVIDEKLEEYRNEIVRLNGMIESGLNENGKYALRKELNDYKRQVQALNDKISQLENDGWLGAVTMSDVLTKTFKYVRTEMRYALTIKDYIDNGRKDGGILYGKSDKEQLMIVSEHFGKKNITAWNYYTFVKADREQPFLDEMFDGYHKDQWDIIESKNADAEKVAEIREKRKQSDAVFDALWERVCKEIQKTTGVPVIYKASDKSGAADILAEDEEDEEESSSEDSEAPESEMEKEEESDRDIQMVANYQRDVTSTLSQKVKRLLASQYDWDFKRTELKGTEEEKNARVTSIEAKPKSPKYTYIIVRDEKGNATHFDYYRPSKDSMFFQPKAVPAGVVFNKLLGVMSNAHGGTGMRNGEELYQYLRDNMEKVTWYHGIVKEMENDPSVKTALFVALRLRHMNFRAAEKRDSYYGGKNLHYSEKEQHNSIVSIAENYDENAEFVHAQMQENMNHGIVVEGGVVGGVTVDLNKLSSSSTLKEFKDKKLWGNGIVLKDISLYDNTGKINVGTFNGEDDGNGNIRNVTELTGAAGFYFLTNTLPSSEKNVKSLFIKDPNMVLHKTYHALRALGLDITRDQMDLAFAAQPYKLNECLSSLKKIGDAVNPFKYRASSLVFKGYETKLASDFISGELKTLSETISGVSDMRPESGCLWASKRYYAWANPSLVDEIVDNLGNIETEEDFMEYVNKRYLHTDDPNVDSSFYMQKDANGKPEVLCTWLRNMIPASNSEADIKKAKFFRNMFKLGYYDHLGVPGWKEGVYKNYDRMEVSDKVLVESLAFFSPKYGNKDLFDKASNSNPELKDNIDMERHGYKAACYAFPIMADSSNHMFYGARRYTTERNKDGSIAEGYSLDSHIKDSLLDGCADVVMQEYHRIKVFMSNAKDGTELRRPEMSKAFNNNKDKFVNFPDLNDVSVRILPKGVDTQYTEMPFLEAIEYLATADNIEELTEAVAVSKDNEHWFTVSRTEGVELYRDMIMEAVHKCYLNDSLNRSLQWWDRAGAISPNSLQSEDSTFKDAFVQYFKRQENVNELLSRLFGAEVEVVGDLDKGYSIQKVAKEDSVLENFASPLKENAIWNELKSYSDPAAGIREGELTWTILSMTDKFFNARMYDLNEQERIKEEARQNNIIGAIAAILDKYNQDKKTSEIDSFLKVLKGESDKPSLNYRNLLYEALQEYIWNKSFAKTQILQLTVGDIAQFKNEADLSKRYKGVAGAYERVDMTAVDTSHDNRLVKEYYGETKIEDEFWQENQKAIILTDFETKSNPATGRTTGFHNLSQFFNEQLLPKLQLDLDAGVIDQQTYMDFCDGYGKMCMTDGQSFRTIQSMKKLCDFLHLSTKGTDEIYQAVVEGRKLRWEQVRDYIQQLKTFSFGFEQAAIDYSARGYGETEGVTQLKHYAQQLTDFTKDSEYTLMLYMEGVSDYLGGDESILKGLYDFCVENQVDCVHFSSTKKIASTKAVDISQCKNAAETKALLTEMMEAGNQDATKSIFHAEPWAYAGRQISTKEHLFDKTQGKGSQVEKLITADMPETYETSVYNEKTGEVEKKTFKTEIIIRDEEGNPAAKLTPQQYREMLTRINITNMREDLLALEKRLGSKEAFAKLLIDQLDRTDKYPEDLLEAIKYNPSTGDFSLSLDSPTLFNAIQPIVASLIRKKVIKQKTRGGTAIQFSSVGRTENLKEVWGTTEDGQKYVKYIECMLPAWSKHLFRAFADKDGNIDINKIPVKMREMVGYRVPTEHIYSMAPLRVVGFLNQEQGSSIMLPQEIVVWAGSDYDIDKVYLEMPDFRITGEEEVLNTSSKKAWRGFYQTMEGQQYKAYCDEYWCRIVEKYIADNNLTEEESKPLQDMIEYYDDANWKKFRKDYCAKLGIGKGRLFDSLAILKDDAAEDGLSIEGLRRDFMAFCERKGYFEVTVKTSDVASPADIANMNMKDWQTTLESVSRMDRDNMYVALHFARLTCPQTLMLLNTPGGFAKQSKMAKIVTILSSRRVKLSFEELTSMPLDELSDMADEYAPRMDIMDACTDDIMFERNMTGKQMVAISALHNAFHAVMQAAPTKLSAAFKSVSDFVLNGKSMRDTLGDIYDEAGRFITRNIGGFLAAAVDTAKDPVIGYLNFNQSTASYYFALLHFGYSIETAVLLMNQPAVRNWFRNNRTLSVKQITDLGVKLDDSLKIDMTHEEMATAISSMSDNIDFVEMMADPIQQRAISILLKIKPIGEVIDVLMAATKITQPKNSMQNSLGKTYERMLPVRNKLDANKVKAQKGEIDIFDPIELETLVMDKFDRDDDVPMLVDDYMNGVMMPDGKLRKPRLPLVQAAYDYGFARPLRYLSRYIGAYGKDTMSLIERLENMGRGYNKLKLDSSIIDKMIVHRRIFSTMSYLCAEEMANNFAMQTMTDMRHAYLYTFPKRYKEVLKNFRETGTDDGIKQEGVEPRDLTQEFSILRHIVYKAPDRGKYGDLAVLHLTKGGKVDKMVQNDLVSSWDLMFRDSDPAVQNLALQLYKYSMFYNGASFAPNAFGGYAPSCILHEFPEYDAALRDLGNSMTNEEQDLFIDQFIRNNTQYFYKKTICYTPMATFDKGTFKKVEGDMEVEGLETRWELTEDVIRLSSNSERMLKGWNYIKTTMTNGQVFYFRRQKDSEGNDCWVSVEELGKGRFPEYDNRNDLVKAGKFTYNSYAAIGLAQMTNLAAHEKEIKERAAREVQATTLEKLAEFSSTITDDRSEGMGNDSTAYIKDGERYMRTHDYMKNKLHRGELSIPKDKDGNPKYNQAQWDRLCDVGRTLGSVFDTYARLWFKELTYGPLSESDKLLRESLFDFKNGPLAQHRITYRRTKDENIQVQIELFKKQLNAVCSGIKSQFPGAKFYTELNGRPIRICNEVMTANGPVKVGGEIDLLVANPDGTFTIVDFKQMSDRNMDYYLKGAASLIEEGNSYRDHQTQLNIYRSIMKSIFPDMDISLCVAPFVTTRGFVERDRLGNPIRVSGRISESGTDEVQVQSVELNKDSAISDAVRTYVIDMTVDPEMSKIPDPIKTTQQEKEEKLAEQQEEIEKEEQRAQPSQSGEIHSYADIFAQYLTPQQMSLTLYKSVYNNLDKNYTGGFIAEAKMRGSDPDTKRKKYLRRILKVGDNGTNLFADLNTLNKSKIENGDGTHDPLFSKEVIDKIHEAIMQNKDVLGDDDVKIC